MNPSSIRTPHARHDQRGASAVEYGLLLTAIASAIVSAVVLLGGHLSVSYTDSCSTIEQQATHRACTAPTP